MGMEPITPASYNNYRSFHSPLLAIVRVPITLVMNFWHSRELFNYSQRVPASISYTSNQRTTRAAYDSEGQKRKKTASLIGRITSHSFQSPELVLGTGKVTHILFSAPLNQHLFSRPLSMNHSCSVVPLVQESCLSVGQ